MRVSGNVVVALVAGVVLGWCAAAGAQPPDLIGRPYQLNTGLVSRSISFENPSGAPGQGGQAASNLGVGRKGAPSRSLEPGEKVQLCDIEGPGTIRHIWLTTRGNPLNLRSCVIRAWWEGQEHPSIECPLGDFFGFAHGKVMPYCSAVHSVGATAGMNIWLPMPFTKRARLEFANEGKERIPLFYQIDYTLQDQHPDDVGRLHVVFRRENPTTAKQDFELLPQRKNKGRYVGAVIGVRNLHPKQWWGEGEIKIYMDGDKDFATIVGTGSEDYVGLAWGLQQTPFFYNGASLNDERVSTVPEADGSERTVVKQFISMYRWHLPDPVFWQKEVRITIQQIAWKNGLAETEDDWSCATFWYEPAPSAPLPPLPDVAARTADIWPEK